MSIAAILIVEDENIVALDMKMRLESLGYRVMGVVDSGAAALEFLSSSVPDLILMDIKLKGNVDGIETARAVRERLNVPIIFVTAFTDEQTLERAKLASPYGYIVKPFHERELRIAIELALYKFQYELSMLRSKELAEEANRVKGEFLANISHELKTPLNSVIGFTQLSLDKVVDDEQRDYLSTVLRSARSLVTLIDSILDFSRLENGKLAPVFAPFAIDTLLGECVDLLSIGASSKGLEVSFRRDPGLPDMVISDKGRLRQILMNLADNAVKFTEKGKIRICAEMLRQADTPSLPRGLAEASDCGDDPGRIFSLRLLVEDSGMGMPTDKIPLAFERFTQLDGSTTRPAGGTGIGLAIVAKSVEILGGSISVRSALGQGSRFEIIVPMVMAADQGKQAEAQPLRGRKFVHIGFSDESSADLEELVASLGGEATRSSGLASILADGSSGTGVIGNASILIHEMAALEEHGTLSSLPDRIIAACRPGFAGRSGLAGFGCTIVALPLRRSTLLEAVDELGGQKTARSTGKPAVAGLPPKARPAPAGSRRGAAPAAATADGRERVAVRNYLDAIAIGLKDQSMELVERESKAFHDRFKEMGAESAERLAFTALLLSRKGDRPGLEELMDKLELLADPVTSSRESRR